MKVWAQREILIHKYTFYIFFIRVIPASKSLYATVHISLLSIPAYNNNTCDKFINETKPSVLFTVRRTANMFTDAFQNFIQNNT